MTSFNVSPAQFYRAFRKVAHEEADALQEVWSRYRDFTSLMRAGVFPKIADLLNLKCYPRDYYTLDAIFYQEEDHVHFPTNTTYAKYISIAIEHENDPGDTAKEMNKLQLFNAPLKVLITYPDSKHSAGALLHRYEKIISWADAFGDIAVLRQQLVIFGLQGSPPEWKGHLYTQPTFSPMD